MMSGSTYEWMEKWLDGQALDTVYSEIENREERDLKKKQNSERVAEIEAKLGQLFSGLMDYEEWLKKKEK